MFIDLRKGTGSAVISSSGGVEYSMESDKWNNGLFTYCLLQGLSSNTADINKDGFVQISELQEYVRSQVSLLSSGRQVPNFRKENLVMDFVVW